MGREGAQADAGRLVDRIGRARRRWFARLGLATVSLAVVGCGDNLYDPFVSLVRVSGPTPFGDGCDGADRGVRFVNVEVEPSLAADPTAPMHLVGAWQQDRWPSGGASGIVTAATFDGGASWTIATPHIGRCSGGTGPAAGYERASDPWLTFAADGTVYLTALVFDTASARNAVVASQSSDGGVTWSEPAVLRADADPDVFNDKESITADPADASRVYAVWDRLTGQTQPTLPVGTGPAWFARTVGGVWQPARPIHDPGLDAQTLGNVIGVLPDGTLLDAFDRITQVSSNTPAHALAVVRSVDGGTTWSDAQVIAQMHGTGVEDPSNHVFIRSGQDLPQIAVDRTSGAVYLVWQDAPTGGAPDAVLLARSRDGGVSWSAPVVVNGAPAAPAFTPSVAVAADGTVGVTYYDLRDARLADAGGFRVTPWLATSRDGGATWSDESLSLAFDLRPALLRSVYFLGDYQGLAAVGAGFVPLFVAATEAAGDRTDVFVRALR